MQIISDVTDVVLPSRSFQPYRKNKMQPHSKVVIHLHKNLAHSFQGFVYLLKPITGYQVKNMHQRLRLAGSRVGYGLGKNIVIVTGNVYLVIPVGLALCFLIYMYCLIESLRWPLFFRWGNWGSKRESTWLRYLVTRSYQKYLSHSQVALGPMFSLCTGMSGRCRHVWGMINSWEQSEVKGFSRSALPFLSPLSFSSSLQLIVPHFQHRMAHALCEFNTEI